MIFLVSKDPFNALQLQNQLKLTDLPPTEIYLSVEEAENNLYKLPGIVLIDENLAFSNLLYLTQSIKIYDAQLPVIWLCKKDGSELQKTYKGYGVTHCIPEDEILLDKSLTKIHSILQDSAHQRSNKCRMEFLKKELLKLDS